MGVHRVEFNEDGDWLAGDVPTACTDCDAGGQRGLLAPFFQHGFRFGEEGRGVFFGPDVGADEYCLVLIAILECFGFCGQHCVDAADFIANFPTCFKQNVEVNVVTIHIYLNSQFQTAKVIKNFLIAK